jgi:hypothetical protein
MSDQFMDEEECIRILKMKDEQELINYFSNNAENKSSPGKNLNHPLESRNNEMGNKFLKNQEKDEVYHNSDPPRIQIIDQSTSSADIHRWMGSLIKSFHKRTVERGIYFKTETIDLYGLYIYSMYELFKTSSKNIFPKNFKEL